MYRLLITLLSLWIIPTISFSQFHTLNIPQASPKAAVSQQLGITNITIEYSSPAVRDRDVWEGVVPFDAQPIAWRAGANMNTRIQFSTDVSINGIAIPAGSYGLHMIPRKDASWSLLLAENDQQWGSYYLDIDKDVFQSIEVKPEECPFRENLAYEFLTRTDSSVVIALEWEKKRIPFTVSVDLNKTVLESFRSELLGINTYRWEAWNDVARWCLRRNTNLEEALSWAERSINGGYNGFAANKNLTNLTTKIQLQKALGRDQAARQTKEEAVSAPLKGPMEVNNFARFLINEGDYDLSKKMFSRGCDVFDDPWFLQLGVAVSDYFLDERQEAVKMMKEVLKKSPDNFKGRIEEMMNEMEGGTFKLG